MSDSHSPDTTENLQFMMGQYAALFPPDRLYATNHMWAVPIEGPRFRFGLTAYAVRLLQDVYFLDWLFESGAELTYRQTIGSIESKKAESDLFAPLTGTLTAINTDALEDPSIINVDCYRDGWLFEIESAAASELLQPSEYLKHLESAWEVAQKTIKGQVNQ